MSKRMGSRARKARKAAIEARAALIVETPGFAKASAMHHNAIQGRTYHATAWNAPTGEGRMGRAKTPTKGRWSRD